MICPNCNKEIPDSVKFCTQCGASVQNAAPVQNVAPVQTAAPVQNAAPVQTAAPVQSTKPAKARKKFNPLAVIIPVVSVAVVAALAAVVYFVLLKEPPLTLTDFEKALSEQDFSTALEISEQLSDTDCEEAVEKYISELLDTDGSEFKKNDKIVQKMFSRGFDDKYKKIYKNYLNGEYTPEKPVMTKSDETAEPTDAASAEETAQSGETSAAASSPEESKPGFETAETPEANEDKPVPEPTMSERLIGHWSREVRTGCYEHIEFFEDGTGYIYSDMVSEKVSKPTPTTPKITYYDGKIHFTWNADDDNVTITADIDPYCFVAYQGYAAPGHFSNATWKGSANNSHDYKFAYDTEDEYLCDMLGMKDTDELTTGESLTNDYWNRFLIICDNAWDKYFYNKDKMDYSKYEIDYNTLEDSYYDSEELQAKYADVDLYHFTVFTKMVLICSDNPTVISLSFDAEDFERAD